jgi:hypothetical protein
MESAKPAHEIKNFCTICNKKFQSKTYYYSHMKIHVTPETKHQFTFKELELIEHYFNARCETKRKSYKKSKVQKKLECSICNNHFTTKGSLNIHYVSKHTKEELIAIGLDEKIIDELEIKRKERIMYCKSYRAKEKIDVNKSFKEAVKTARDELHTVFESLLQFSSNPVIYKPTININVNVN